MNKSIAQIKEVDNEISSFFEEEDINIFSSSYQDKFIKVFLEEPIFAEQILDIVEVEFFDGYQKALLNHILNYIKIYGIGYNFEVLYDDLQDYVSDKESGIVKEHLVQLISKIRNYSSINSNVIKSRAYEFFKRQSVKNAIKKVAKKWKQNDFESIQNLISDALKAGEPRVLGHDYLADIDKRLEKNFRKPITFLSGLDNEFDGGLSPGELGVVMAPTGGGKSMCLVRFAVSALLAGKKVVYYTLELEEPVIGQRFDACINKVPLKHVWDYVDIIKESAEDIAAKGGNLKIAYMPSGEASINTLKAHVTSLVREGFMPDVIFIDYADLLKYTGDFKEKKDALTQIYESLRAWGMEIKCPIWSATQTNRSAFGESEFNLSSIAESAGKANTADVIIGIGRDPDQKNDLKANLLILKNRNGRDGYTVPAHFDTRRVYIEVIIENKESSNKNLIIDDSQMLQDNSYTSINDILKQNQNY